MNEFMGDNWWWIALSVPVLLVGTRTVVKATKSKWDDRIFVPIIDIALKIWNLVAKKRGK